MRSLGLRLCLFVLLVLMVVSCTTTVFDTDKEVWAYLKDSDHGFVHTKSVNGVDFTLLYKPTDLMVQQELSETYTEADVARFREKYTPYLYFTLSMSRGNQELLNSLARDRNQFGTMVNTLAFGMDQKVHLYTEKKDTIPMLDFVYPRMYGMSRSTSLLLVYPKEELKDAKELTLSIEDLGFGTGEVHLVQETKKIHNQPSIRF